MPRRTRAPVYPQFFTCTFCWHLSRGPPHVLGRSARLACDPCYNAVIDLAIYWVCGEIVCRGSECVSLGWCFWHRACYGCLLCGSRLIAQGTTVRQLFCDDEDSTADATGQGVDIQNVATLAKEIQDVPLCAYCIADIEADKLDHAKIMQKALRRTDKTDGGLSRSRWERKQGTISRSVMGQIKRVPGKMTMVSDETAARTFPEVSRQAVDGTGSEAPMEENMACVVPLNSTIYVSILDPLGEPAFKPHPTKPIPQWLQGAASRQRQSKPHAQQRPVSTLDEHYRDATSPSARSPTPSNPLIICPTRSSSPRLHTPPQRLRRRGSQARDTFRNPLDASQESLTISSHNTSFVTSETLKRPSSRLTEQIASGGSTPNVPYRADHRDGSPFQAMTSQPNTPARKAAHPTRPARSRQPPNTEPAEKTQDRKDTDTPWSLHNRSSSPLAEAVISKLHRIVRKTPPTHSDEYLHLYKPAQKDRGAGNRATMSSNAVAGRKRGRRVEREDFDAMIRGTGGAAGREAGGNSNQDDSHEARERQSRVKRQSLQKELKRLLGRGGGDTETGRP